MKLLAVDFETQDDKPQTTRITEVGASMVHVAHVNGDACFSWNPIYSQFCYEPEYPPQDDFIAELTGITDTMLQAQGVPRRVALEKLIPMIAEADYVLAHKKAFDQVVFESTCRKLGLEFPKKPWLCTLSEFEWPRKFTCKKLGHLAFEHGLFDCGMLDRTKLHRAGDDASLLLRLITTYYDVDKMLAYYNEPWVYYKADCLPPWKDNGEQKEIAYKMGFTYEKCKHTEGPVWPKTWVQRIKYRDQVTFTSKAQEAPFRISRIEGLN